MKNYRFLLVWVVMLGFFACKKEENMAEENPKLLNPAMLLTVHISADYFEDASQTGYIVASKEDGTTLDYKLIENGATVTLETYEGNIADFTATLVVNRPNNLEQKGLRLYSYLEMPVGGAWWLEYPSYLDFDGSFPVGWSNIVIEGCGTIAPSPLVFSSIGNGSGSSNADNNLQIGFPINTSQPTVPALAVYSSNLDNQVRYFFQDALPIGETTSVQHADLPIIASPTSIDFDTDAQLSYGISGLVAQPGSNPKRLFLYNLYGNLSGTQQFYLPSNVFEKYHAGASGWLPDDGRSFSTSIYSETLPTSFTYPDFDFEVEGSGTEFTFNSSSDLSHFFVRFKNTAINDFAWEFGSIAKPTVKFKLPTVPPEVLNAYNLTSLPVVYRNCTGVRITPAQPAAAFYKNLYPSPETVTSPQGYYREDAILRY
jgi:hypothetical protein